MFGYITTLQSKKKRLAFEAIKSDMSDDKDTRETERKERLAGIVGRTSHIKYHED